MPQKLPPESVALIQSLWEFLGSDPQARLEAAQKACARRILDLEKVSLNYLGPDSRVRHLLQDEAPLNIRVIEILRAALADRRRETTDALAAIRPAAPPPAIRFDPTDLHRLVKVRRDDITSLGRSDTGERLKLTEDRLRRLRHRKLLNKHLTSIQEYVTQVRWAARARQMLGTTKAITTKYNDLFRELVTERYTSTFEKTLHRFKADMEATIETRGPRARLCGTSSFDSTLSLLVTALSGS